MRRLAAGRPRDPTGLFGLEYSPAPDEHAFPRLRESALCTVRKLRSLEDFTEVENNTAYFDGDDTAGQYFSLTWSCRR